MSEAVIAAALSSAVGTIQQRSQVRAQQRAAQAAQAREIEQRRMQQEQREKAQQKETKRRQASARAAFGARGVSSTGGSANALIDGFAAETDRKIADDREMMEFGIESLRQNQRAQNRLGALSVRNSLLSGIVDTGNAYLTAKAGDG